MKIKFISIILLLTSITFYSKTYGQNTVLTESTIIGKWLTHDHRALIEIYKEGEKYFGKIDSLLVSSPIESLIGLTILKDFKERNDKYVDGTMYDPESNSTFRCKLWLEDENSLMVRDYCGLFHQTFTWKRIK